MTNEKEKQRKQTFAEIIEQYGMNKEQVEFYQTYSKERSCLAYEKIAKEKMGSTELVADWKYDGYYDAGYRGADHCSAGHALRYVHIAKNIKTGEEVKFGIKCVSDFFSITPAQLKFIKAGFNEANREIMSSIDKYVKYDGDYAKYTERNKIDEKFHYVMDKDSTQLMRKYNDQFEELMKLAEMSKLCELRLPFPDEFEWRIGGAYRSLKYMEEREARKAIKEKSAEEVVSDFIDEADSEEVTEEETNEMKSVTPSFSVVASSKVVITPEMQELLDTVDTAITDEYIKENHKTIMTRLENCKARILQGGVNATSSMMKASVDKLAHTHFKDIDEAIEKIDNAKKTNSFVRSIAYQLNHFGLTEKQENAIKRIADKL